MTTRRVDKTDPRNAAAVRPLTLPIAWLKDDDQMYEATLSGLAYVGLTDAG